MDHHALIGSVSSDFMDLNPELLETSVAPGMARLKLGTSLRSRQARILPKATPVWHKSCSNREVMMKL